MYKALVSGLKQRVTETASLSITRETQLIYIYVIINQVVAFAYTGLIKQE